MNNIAYIFLQNGTGNMTPKQRQRNGGNKTLHCIDDGRAKRILAFSCYVKTSGCDVAQFGRQQVRAIYA